MSFTEEVCEELLTLPLKKTCCRKSLLMGLLTGATEQEDGELSAVYRTEGACTLTAELLEKIFHTESNGVREVRAGRTVWTLSFVSERVGSFLKSSETGGETVEEAVGFRCENCQHEFLRGAFLSCATVSHPKSGYHLELILPSEPRADALRRFLEARIGKTGKVSRGRRVGLYYKSNGSVTDFLYYIGCSSASFEVANRWIEKDIRNDENRATNCVTSNILRSVEASKKQREAIEFLYETHQIDSLDEELKETAALRLEYPAASLSELAALHRESLSKSGLNRRLKKLTEIAEGEK